MNNLSEIHLAVVCPMANEGPAGVRFASEALKYCGALGKTTFFAVLDTATRDNSRELLEEYSQQEPRLKVVWAPENRCVVDAYMRGYSEALRTDADWILEIDAGFSHDPSQIPQFFRPMLEGADCAFGSRFIRGGRIDDSSSKRLIVSWGGTALTNLLIGTKLHDMTSGFEMFTRETLAYVLQRGIHSRAHFFQTEIKVHCRKLKYAEVPITYRMASPGMSSGPVNEAFGQLWRLFKLRLSGKLDGPPSMLDQHARSTQARNRQASVPALRGLYLEDRVPEGTTAQEHQVRAQVDRTVERSVAAPGTRVP